ncbi:hypothetical protein KWT13_19220 [Clostridioides difficile]|uniref:hypothetical protein n=1 Tax=Clostridioides difficile TaxID=1496 RepID=UPI0008A5119A|nr:hypothetical protein [Clostridioides difficile]OFU33352.1 hypothetical protein HMPREF3075_05520 [Clostridium sp. HMSC19B11]MBF4710574.1 hypothetical protein [Clostridioides difficile]MBY1488947.1 hypothetical protein [Clostridioides difficile]MBY1863138.1 hypothetical protein [Clostridioides difficile]MDE3516466.1 hypothetical protein [Clostridioides difficile]
MKTINVEKKVDIADLMFKDKKVLFNCISKRVLELFYEITIIDNELFELRKKEYNTLDVFKLQDNLNDRKEEMDRLKNLLPHVFNYDEIDFYRDEYINR